MTDDFVNGLRRSRVKLVDLRRSLVKRDGTTDRSEGYVERIVQLQAAIEATDRAIEDEQALLLDAHSAVDA